MDPRDVVRRSKLLSYLLRHAPGSVGLTLDAAGWADAGALLAALGWTRAELEHIVATNDKRRFAVDDTGTRIRASQGHSVAVDLGYAAEQPPRVLFHGTAEWNLPTIEAEGLRPGRRHAVHLSPDEVTAHRVGARHGRAVVLRIDAEGMARDGAVFTRSANGVWLVDAVPPAFVTVVG